MGQQNNDNMIFRFIGNHIGEYSIASQVTITGLSLPRTNYLSISTVENNIPQEINFDSWVIDGIKSNLRYTTQKEKIELESSTGSNFSRSYISCMIPIKKSDAWWNLAQDERREIIEEQSKHFSIGLKYMQAIERTLYHSKDLNQAFDFVTWFNFYPENESLFNELVHALRESLEWTFVTREIDFRMFKK